MTAYQLYVALIVICVGLPVLTVVAIFVSEAWRRMFTSDYVGIATRHRKDGSA